jgi:hypothetical protein
VHQIECPEKSALAELVLEPADVAVHQWLHEGVGASCGDALVFPQFGHHVRGKRYRDLREQRPDRLTGCAFMRGIAIGVQKADGDRLDPVGHELARRVTDRCEIDLSYHQPVAIHPLRHLQTAAAVHQRFRVLQEEVLNVVALLRAHLQDIAKSPGGDQPKFRPFPLDQRIGHQCSAVHDFADIGEMQSRAATISSSPSSAPTEGSSGVVRNLCSRISARSASSRMKSVKVPPMSKPIR